MGLRNTVRTAERRFWSALHVVGAITSAGWRSLQLSLVISIFAVALSGSAFYRTFLFSKQALRATLLELKAKNGSIQMNFAVFNDGTTDGLIRDIHLYHWAANSWTDFQHPPQEFDPVVVKPQEIRVIQVHVAVPGMDELYKSAYYSTPIRGDNDRALVLSVMIDSVDVTSHRYMRGLMLGFIGIRAVDKTKTYVPPISEDYIVGSSGYSSFSTDLFVHRPDIESPLAYIARLK